MDFFRVKNWGEFQHYKDRTPPWIKFYTSLLTDYDFLCLQDASKLQLTMIWLYAAQSGNKIPDDPSFLQRTLNLEKKPNLNLLEDRGFLERYQADSNTLAESKQVAPVTVHREEKRREEKKGASKGGNGRFKPPTLEEVTEYCTARGNSVDPAKFIAHYEAGGWMRGKTKIKNWKACVHTWESRDSSSNPPDPCRGAI
jgi:hypothetical protein